MIRVLGELWIGMKRLPFLEARIPVWSYWLFFILVTCGAAFAFAGTGGRWCTLAALDAVRKSDATNCFEYWLNRYQTILAGTFAIVAAIVGFLAVRSQTNASYEIERYRREREEDAARAVLPVALGEICAYADLCIQNLQQANREENHTVTLPPFPVGVLPTIQNCIRASTGDNVASLKKLISVIQIFRSRYVSSFTRPHRRDQCELDICHLLVQTERLFSYGRTTDLRTDMTFAETDHAIFTLKIGLRAGSALDHYREFRRDDGSASIQPEDDNH